MKKDVDKGRMIGYNSQADSEKLRLSKLKNLGFEARQEQGRKPQKNLKNFRKSS